MFCRILCVIGAFVVGFSGQAHAATASIAAITGKVLVRNHDGVAAAYLGQHLGAGATIIVGADGEALVLHGECRIILTATSMLTVSKTAPCQAGQTYHLQQGMLVTPASSTGTTASLGSEQQQDTLGNVVVGVSTFSVALIGAMSSILEDDPISPETN